MPNVELDVLALSSQASDEDIRACAAIINRRHQFEPNRLRSVTRTDDERLQSKTIQLKKHLSNPRTTAYFAKNVSTGAVMGWISWLNPNTNNAQPSDTSDANGQALQMRSILKAEDDDDPERDYDAVKAVSAEKKRQEKYFFGDHPFW